MTTINNDTIVAISTPHGMGGIAVVRVSGDDAISIVAKRWKGAPISEMKSHTAHFGRLLDTSGELLDEVVLTLFRGPHSFTGEDVIEIACHGSMWIQQQVVNTLIDAGCRSATGGEFTQRAFGNGKLDLSQAEAIADVIASSSRASHRVAMNQMRGAFSRRLTSLRAQLLQFVSLIELELDFSEEEVNFADRGKLIDLATGIKSVIYSLADSYSAGNAIKNGLPVAIVGQTNAGKSTLLNALLGDDRALVSDIKGTTRDVIENMGIERSFKKLDEAQLVLWVVDPSEGADEIATFSQQILPRCEGKKLLVVVNKIDTTDQATQTEVARVIEQQISGNVEAQTIYVSARDGQNMEALNQAIIKMAALPSVADDEAVIVTNARHYEALVRAGEAITRSIDGLYSGISGDFVSQDIRECMHYLGEITGEISTDDILGEIFSHFCIGK